MLQVEQLENRLMPSTFTVTNLADNCFGAPVIPGSLRDAIVQVNKDRGLPVTDVVQFDPSLFADGQVHMLEVLQAFNVIHHFTLQGPGKNAAGVNMLCLDGSSDLNYIDKAGVTHFVQQGTGCWVVYPPDDNSPRLAGIPSETAFLTTFADFDMENFTSCPRTDSGAPMGPLSGAFPGVAIFSRESLCIERMCIENCHNTVGGTGGAVQAGGLSFMAETCMLEGNTSAGNGGAIGETAGATTIDGCTFTGNTAAGYGGAVYLFADAAGDNTASVSNSTFQGNAAKAGTAIYVHQTYHQPKVIVDVSLGDFFDVGQTIVE